jgi:hypothetical protein
MIRSSLARAAFATFATLLALPLFAHCDGLDGPVVTAARKALDTRDVNHVLIWVQPAGEAEVRAAFTKTLEVRILSPQARALADTWFFETLVRVHRAGEGAPYTGLKPAGRDLGPAIPAADEAVRTGDHKPLLQQLHTAVTRGIHARFHSLHAAASFDPANLAAGRAYVKAYVDFLHYIEGLDKAARAAGHAHAEAHAAAAEAHNH